MKRLLFFLFLFPAFAGLSQVDRVELGIQTTRRGVIWVRDTLPRHKPNWRLSRDTNAVFWMDTTTALRYDWDYKNDRWRTKGVYKDSLPPLPQYYHTIDSVVIDNTTALWIRDTFNILHKYDSTCQAWTPIGDWIIGDTVPSNIAATDSNGAAIYTRSLWQNDTTHIVKYWTGTYWKSFDDGIYGDGSPGSGSDTLPPGGSSVTIPGPWQGLSFGINNSGGPLNPGPWWHAITISSEYCADDMFIDLFTHISEQDSFKIRDYDCETFIIQYNRDLNLISGIDLNINADSAVNINGDSVNVQQVGTITEMPFVLGQIGNTLKRIEGSEAGQVLKWDGSNWVLGDDETGGGGGPEPTDLSFSGASSTVRLNSSSGEDVAFKAGTGIGLTTDLSGTIDTMYIANTAPDLVVTISGTGITVGGTYPAFTLTAADQSATNEIQNLSISGQSLSISSGNSVNLPIIGVAAGTGISVSTSGGIATVTNTAPEQAVSISGVGITVTGSHPSFTLTAADQSATNEIQALSTASNTVTLSSGGGNFTVAGGGINTVTTSGSTITVTATENDGNTANEGILGVGAGNATSSTLVSNTATSNAVTINAAGILSISETTSANGGSITITGAEADGSTTNEIQAYSHAGTTTYTNTLSSGGGSWSITGAGIAAISQTGGAITVTATENDGNSANEGLLGVGAGNATSSTITTNTTGGNPVTVNVAGILTIAETTSSNGGSITITGTENDGNAANEGVLGVGAGGATSSTLLSNTAGANAVTINAGGIIAISETANANGGQITITAAEVDGSATNEGQLSVGAGGSNTSTIESNTSGSSAVTISGGTGISVTESGNTITVTNSAPDQTVSITGAGINAVTGTYPSFTITATEVDGSTTNEIQNLSLAGQALGISSGGTGVTLPVIDIAAGAGIGVTSAAGVYTISATGGGSTVDGAENGLYLSGTKVRLGSNPLFENTVINQSNNTMTFHGGKWRYTSQSSPTYTPTQQFGVSGAESLPTISSPTTDGIIEFRPHLSNSMQTNSLTIGGYPTDNFGMWLQSRSAEQFNTYYQLMMQPRGGRFAVGRNNLTQGHVTLSAIGLLGNTASGRVLMLENSEGNGFTGMGFGTGADNLGAEITWQSSASAFRITNRNNVAGTSNIRFAMGAEVDDVAIFVKSPNTTSRIRAGFGVATQNSVHSTVQSNGSIATAFVQTTGALTLGEQHHTAIYTLNSTVSWTLPDPSTCTGRQYVLHHFGLSGQIGLNYSVISSSGNTFNAVPARAWAWIISDGTNWRGYRVNSI